MTFYLITVYKQYGMTVPQLSEAGGNVSYMEMWAKAIIKGFLAQGPSY